MVWPIAQPRGTMLASANLNERIGRQGMGTAEDKAHSDDASRGDLRRRLMVGAISVGLLGIWAGPVHAQRLQAPALYPTKNLPRRPNSPAVDVHGSFLMRADEVSYDRDSDTVTASGHVE